LGNIFTPCNLHIIRYFAHIRISDTRKNYIIVPYNGFTCCVKPRTLTTRGVYYKNPKLVLGVVSRLDFRNKKRKDGEGALFGIQILILPNFLKGQTVLQICITDTGIGIEPEFYPQVFRPFSQMDNSNSRQYGGVGLGLAISKCMADLMGGK
jgi:hypothetical protein